MADFHEDPDLEAVDDARERRWLAVFILIIVGLLSYGAHQILELVAGAPGVRLP